MRNVDGEIELGSVVCLVVVPAGFEPEWPTCQSNAPTLRPPPPLDVRCSLNNVTGPEIHRFFTRRHGFILDSIHASPPPASRSDPHPPPPRSAAMIRYLKSSVCLVRIVVTPECMSGCMLVVLTTP